MFGQSMRLPSLAATLLLGALGADAFISARQLPAEPTRVKTIKTPQNYTIRYKEPGLEGVCETTPGVKSFSGYIDIAPDAHTFFWFFEARTDPASKPITLWLNGGPGSDSLIGLFEELGPCRVAPNLTSYINPHSFSTESNMIFISQPLGVGFSYATEGNGTINPITGDFQNASIAGVDGRYPLINATLLDTTDLSAVATYHALQGILGGLTQLDSNITTRSFNLWTESYGGHYGPAFYDYFYQENLKIANGTAKGIHLDFHSLGIGNGIIDEVTQAPYYPEFAVNNTYGIKAVNDTVYNYMKFALNMNNGCLQQIGFCRETNYTTLIEQSICAEAENMCRDNVEGLYYAYSNRGTYDIRVSALEGDAEPPSYYENYVNLPAVQNALGVDLNYTQDANNEVYYAFQNTGDFVYPNFIDDLEYLLSAGLRVNLYYGDADYICNWLGGQAVSLAVNYTHAGQFRAADYVPLTVEGESYGEVRQAGNFSFVRVFESGHLVPAYQPVAALAMFARVIHDVDVATGYVPLTAAYNTTGGTANATHTESTPPSATATAAAASWTVVPRSWDS
ncbi:MAG: hypothetical protein M1819_002163 [Sarea resinae]|nr:MAG: hypothetical protein M1819_002163 [Sarea resinae]